MRTRRHSRIGKILKRIAGIAGAAITLTQSLVVLAQPVAPIDTKVAINSAAADEQAYQKMLLAAASKYFPGDDRSVSAKRIFRLTRDQIDATVATLLPGYVTQSVKATMSKDPLQMNYEYAELLSFGPANLSALTTWFKEIAGRVAKSPSGVIDCKSKNNANDCLQAEARRFAIKAFRGDIADDKLELLVKFYMSGVQSVGFPQATAELVEIVLSSPDFLFRKELDVDRSRRLAPAQLLQALTYSIADVPPEALQLNSTSTDQYFRRPATIDAMLKTVMGAKETREKLVRFFKAWLEVKEPGAFTISEKTYPEFNAKLAGAMLDETDRFLRAQLNKSSPTLRDITQATQSFVSPELAPIYGLKVAGADSSKPASLDPAQRLGIFSQPAVIASHSGPTNTRPVKRGVFWVRKIMCMELEPPPPGIDLTLYEDANTTERQRIEQVTAKKACIGCHKLIDPLGFFQEHYDALGRWRTKDNGFPVDTKVEIGFLDEGPTTTTTPVEALATFTNSLMFKQCFVRQMFRYYLGRSEEPSDDPMLREMFLAFVQNDNLLDLVAMLATSQRIGRRL